MSSQSTRWFLSFGFAAIVASAIARSGDAQVRPVGAAAAPILRRVHVHYFTNRVKEGVRNGRPVFGAKVGPLSAGYAEVSIAKGFRISDRHGIRITSLKPAKPEGMYRELKKTTKSRVLIYVHGFYIAFEESIQRVAQIVHSYDYRGTVVVFSWPSLCRFSKNAYFADRKSLDASAKVFREFLKGVVGAVGGNRVQILAHSLACRLIGSVAAELVKSNTAIRLANVVFASPDVDVVRFGDYYVKPLLQIADRFTIYHSQADSLLGFAGNLNDGRERLGRAGPGKHLSVESIDFTALGGWFAAHNFYREHPAIVLDIRGVLSGAIPFCRREIIKRPRLAARRDE